MKLASARHLKEAADSLEVDLEVREAYSGRRMYGKEVSGVVCRVTDLVYVVANAVQKLMENDSFRDADNLIADLRGLSIDSMGRFDSIIY